MRNLFISNDPIHKDKRRDLRKNFTDAERKLWTKLRNKQLNGFKFYRQYGIGYYILDFYCHKAKLAVEADGGQHLQDLQIIYDKCRTEFLNKNGIKVLRFSDIDILKNLDGVIFEIKRNLTPPNLLL